MRNVKPLSDSPRPTDADRRFSKNEIRPEENQPPLKTQTPRQQAGRNARKDGAYYTVGKAPKVFARFSGRATLPGSGRPSVTNHKIFRAPW